MKTNKIHFETISSTNNWAKEHLDQFDKSRLTIVTADEQTQGYGQRKQRWVSNKGDGLWVSFCFYVEESPDGLVLTRVMAESLVKFLKQHGVAGTIKWPNDLLVDGKKIAGVLCEICDHWVVIGVGLNINMKQESLDKIDQPATSIFCETGIEKTAAICLQELESLFTRNSF